MIIPPALLVASLVLFVSDSAFADAATTSPANPMGSMFMFGLIAVLMYFMMIRPQSKKAKEHKKLISELAVGDEILTNGGIVGKITKNLEGFLLISIADGVDITIQRQAVVNALPKGTLKSIK